MITKSDDFRIEFIRDTYDVTSNHRPDTSWKFVDKAGHVHQWFDGDSQATDYVPTVEYSVPSVLWIKTGVEYYEDGSTYEVGDYHCIVCGEIVEPGYTADTHNQHIVSDIVSVSGWCLIDNLRGFELLTSLKRVSISEVLRDVKDYESIAGDLPDYNVIVTKAELNTADGVRKVWFQS